MADFEGIFGSDLKILEAKYLHYMHDEVASPAHTPAPHRKR
jgi:hypothetical protein